METRQGMNENRLCLKALFYPCRGEPMPAAVAVVARWSPPATGNMLPVAATSQAGSSHAQQHHAFISYTVITDPEEYTSGMERSSSINARLSFIADTFNQHHQMLAAGFHQEFLSFQPSDTIILPSQPTLMLSNNNNSSSTFQNF